MPPSAEELVEALEPWAATLRWRDRDTGIGVRVAPIAEERAWILPLDVTEAARGTALSVLGRASGPICDLIVVMERAAGPVLCAVELKGRNITRGLTQLLAVVNDLLVPKGQPVDGGTAIRACLLSTSSEPGGRHYSLRRGRLEELLGRGSVLVRTGLPPRTELEITAFIRGGR